MRPDPAAACNLRQLASPEHLIGWRLPATPSRGMELWVPGAPGLSGASRAAA